MTQDNGIPKHMLDANRRPLCTYHDHTYPRISLAETQFAGKAKTVLITGGATGIGFAIAKAFANANVERIVLVCRSVASQQKASAELVSLYDNTEAVTFAASIDDRERMTEILNQVGQIDVLVLATALTQSPVAAQEDEMNVMDQTIDTNLLAPASILHTYLNLSTPKLGCKTVLNVTTLSAESAASNTWTCGPSKAAFIHVLQQLADKETSKSVHERARLFSYHPGTIHEHGDNLSQMNSVSTTPLEDMSLAADFAVWLAGPQSNFLRGRFLCSHWDVEELIALKERIASDANFLRLGLVQ